MPQISHTGRKYFTKETQIMANTINEIKGYSLFKEVEDKAVQIFNRARVMKNIMLDYSDKNKVVNGVGTSLLYQYFSEIPEEDRKAVHDKLGELLKQKEVE